MVFTLTIHDIVYDYDNNLYKLSKTKLSYGRYLSN